ncbi:lanthionine synthetase C family protein [Streptomyces xiamenensis]|uniref:lanthionine synthetase C family protein n=1 Tax=Streptomyces xiamenensis TaxID=408015 RepID=UPI0036E7435C
MSTTLSTRAAQAAMNIAQELRDPETVTATLSDRAAHTLCYGFAGTALLHACLTDTEPSSPTTAAAHWRAAGRLLGTAPPDGIHTGPGALAASLIIGTGYLPPHDPHHALVPRATTWLSARATALTRHYHQRAEQQQATPWAIYDAIKGLTGIGRALLAAHTRGYGGEAEPGLRAALDALTHLILTPIGTRPGWWLPADLHPPTVKVPATGAATTGLAHGIAGPLTLLSTAHQAQHTVPGQDDAIRAAGEWLLAWQTPQRTWPPHIPGNALDRNSKATTHAEGRTTAWCYGTPGIARALEIASRAVGDRAFHRAATQAMAALATRPPEDWDTEGTALCHGSAGILHTAQRLHQPNLADRATYLTLNTPHSRTPGFLTGRAGTALALADYAGLLPTSPAESWDCLLLLS